MIKEISNLGFMSLLGSPMLFKLVPKNAIGNVAKKMADHYLRSGRFLHEANRQEGHPHRGYRPALDSSPDVRHHQSGSMSRLCQTTAA